MSSIYSVGISIQTFFLASVSCLFPLLLLRVGQEISLMLCLCRLDYLVILNHAGCHWHSSRLLLALFPVWFCLMGFLYTFQPLCNLSFICDFKLSFEHHISYVVKPFFLFFHLYRNPGKAQVLLSQQDAEGLIYVWITAQVELLQ